MYFPNSSNILFIRKQNIYQRQHSAKKYRFDGIHKIEIFYINIFNLNGYKWEKKESKIMNK